METPTVLGSLEKANLGQCEGPNRVGVSIPSPEDGIRSNFRNVVFSSYLEFRTMGKVYEPSDP
jgi:hypothetical protein